MRDMTETITAIELLRKLAQPLLSAVQTMRTNCGSDTEPAQCTIAHTKHAQIKSRHGYHNPIITAPDL